MLKKIFLVSSLFLILLTGCFQPPKTIPEPVELVTYTIPANFTTHTYSGIFEISYPNDWSTTPYDVEQQLLQEWEGSTGNVPGIEPEEAKAYPSVGKPYDDYYWETLLRVSSNLVPTFWSLEDCVEGTKLWSEEALPNYQVLSETRISIRSSAIIVEDTYTWPSYGSIWNLTLYTIQGDTLWMVACGTDLDTKTTYEETFWSVLRSFRAW